jgi:hypothetical protein
MLMIGSSAGVIGTENGIELFFFSLCILVSHSAKKRDFAGVTFGLGLQSQQTWRLERPGSSDVDEDTFDDVC